MRPAAPTPGTHGPGRSSLEMCTHRWGSGAPSPLSRPLGSPSQLTAEEGGRAAAVASSGAAPGGGQSRSAGGPGGPRAAALLAGGGGPRVLARHLGGGRDCILNRARRGVSVRREVPSLCPPVSLHPLRASDQGPHTPPECAIHHSLLPAPRPGDPRVKASLTAFLWRQLNPAAPGLGEGRASSLCSPLSGLMRHGCTHTCTRTHARIHTQHTCTCVQHTCVHRTHPYTLTQINTRARAHPFLTVPDFCAETNRLERPPLTGEQRSGRRAWGAW